MLSFKFTYFFHLDINIGDDFSLIIFIVFYSEHSSTLFKVLYQTFHLTFFVILNLILHYYLTRV